ncbi:MAG: type II toxin-antitoxin system RelE/ParE family toxin [Phreatobacter sp.]|uniref:type II toxin-antitoxin system RelE/ParE family toxin n=1 Tax=Phreatobacter sp. TaxID=1966341 RepID=UPI002733EB24|nr:type II toxin-antitoxin system RelE/ParE family toxin [Phreatobacter sp.]MDP2803729.1 type II toxin-antitoxin system RelE/ParE family toxin [Phreatobacter sp.]
MVQIRQTAIFASWFRSLRDQTVRARIMVRIDRLALGNPGDVAPVGEGVSELRVHAGPGYRIYFTRRGEEIVILLCGGDKSSQARDIEAARRLAQEERKA